MKTMIMRLLALLFCVALLTGCGTTKLEEGRKPFGPPAPSQDGQAAEAPPAPKKPGGKVTKTLSRKPGLVQQDKNKLFPAPETLVSEVEPPLPQDDLADQEKETETAPLTELSENQPPVQVAHTLVANGPPAPEIAEQLSSKGAKSAPTEILRPRGQVQQSGVWKKWYAQATTFFHTAFLQLQAAAVLAKEREKEVSEQETVITPVVDPLVVQSPPSTPPSKPELILVDEDGDRHVVARVYLNRECNKVVFSVRGAPDAPWLIEPTGKRVNLVALPTIDVVTQEVKLLGQTGVLYLPVYRLCSREPSDVDVRFFALNGSADRFVFGEEEIRKVLAGPTQKGMEEPNAVAAQGALADSSKPSRSRGGEGEGVLLKDLEFNLETLTAPRAFVSTLSESELNILTAPGAFVLRPEYRKKGSGSLPQDPPGGQPPPGAGEGRTAWLAKAKWWLLGIGSLIFLVWRIHSWWKHRPKKRRRNWVRLLWRT